MIRSFISLLVLGAVATAAPAQTIVFAREGAAGMDLWTVVEGAGAPGVAFSGVTFLDIGLAGAPRHQRLRLDRPVLDAASSPAAHVRLPTGGALYRIAHGGQTSLLHVRADGTPVLLLTLSDVGGVPAIERMLAASGDGTVALAASTPAAGGDVYRLDLPGGTASTLTALEPPLDISDRSLRVSPERAWFVADGMLWRADLTGGNVARALPGSAPPGITLLDEIVMSGDGLTAAFLLEDGAGLRRIGTADPLGQLRLAVPTPSDYDLPGYDLPTGPFLSLSHDGALLAFRHTVIAKELFVCRTDVTAPGQQVTADANFADTIDNVGVIGFVGARLLAFAAGETGPAGPSGPIDSADLFVADFTTPTPQLLNVSQTSGVAAAPFLDPGELEILEVCEDPLGERLIVVADTSGSGDALLAAMPLDGSAGLQQLTPSLDGFPTLTAMGTHVLVQHPTSEPGVPSDWRDVRLLNPPGAAQALTLFGSAPPALAIERVSVSPALDRAAFVATGGPDLELLVLVELPTSTPLVVWPEVLGYSAATGFSPSGRLLTGLGFTAGPQLFAAFDGPSAGSALPIPIGTGFPLNR